jgi:sulfhydrogenase subunit beta (sulfur reductase)
VSFLLDLPGLDALLQRLADAGYEVIGPTVRDGAVGLDEVASIDELPVGWTDEQAPGHYRLRQVDSQERFAHVVGPHAPRRWLQPPERRLFKTKGQGRKLRVIADAPSGPPTALIGVRACDLAGIDIHARVLTGGDHADPHFAHVQEGLFVIAVNCTHPASTCFCTSMGGGPRARGGFDLALTELEGGAQFVVEVGSERGEAMLGDAPAASADTERQAAGRVEHAATQIERRLDSDAARDALAKSARSDRWEAIGERCLACANCTLVCPTCFCTTVTDVTLLDGSGTERHQRWDSCFHTGHSYMHGGAVRPTTAQRYRQWLTHKLSSWHEQFGSSGCTGCGRCVTWCPVGIDLVAEANAFIEEATS